MRGVNLKICLYITFSLLLGSFSPIFLCQKAYSYSDTDLPAHVMTFGGYTGNGELNIPQGIYAYSADRIYVADSYNNRIQIFDSNGNFVKMWGSYGTGNTNFKSPAGLEVIAGKLYVADSGNNVIKEFDLDGNYLATRGAAGSGNGEFSLPYDYCF